MATLLDDGFEAGVPPAWFDAVTGTGMVDETTIVYAGGHSAYFNCTGSISFNAKTALNKRTVVGRFYLRVNSAVSGTASITICLNVNGNLQLMLRPGPAMRAEVGATLGTNSSALTIGQWYRIDYRMDCSTGTASVEYQIDGAAQPTASRAQASADMTALRLGNTGTNTYQAYVDVLKITDTGTDYPIGPSATLVGGVAPRGTASPVLSAGIVPPTRPSGSVSRV
jgi:hypothetical protein